MNECNYRFINGGPDAIQKVELLSFIDGINCHNICCEELNLPIPKNEMYNIPPLIASLNFHLSMASITRVRTLCSRDYIVLFGLDYL